MPRGGNAVVDAFKGRPEAFSTFCCFMAHTPSLSDGSEKTSIEPVSVDFTNAESIGPELLPDALSPEQNSAPYMRVMSCCVKLFLLLATLKVATELCESRHFLKAALRLVELVGRHRVPMSKDERAVYQLAVLARDALCAVTSFGTEEACAFVNTACHPFLPSVSAESLVASVRSTSGIAFSPKPLGTSQDSEGETADTSAACLALYAASLSILSRWHTGLWLAPLSTLQTVWPWFAAFVVLPSGLRSLSVPAGCFWGIPATSMGTLLRIVTALALAIPTVVVFEVSEEPLVKHFMPARVKRLLNYA